MVRMRVTPSVPLKLTRLISHYIRKRGKVFPLDTSRHGNDSNAFLVGKVEYIWVFHPTLLHTASDKSILQKKPMSMVTLIYLAVRALDILLVIFFLIWKRTQLRYLGMVSMLYVLHCIFYINARMNNRFLTGGKPLALLRVLALHGNQCSSGDGTPRLRQALTCIMCSR